FVPDRITNICKESSGVKEEILKNFIEKDQLSDDPQLIGFLVCFFDKGGLLSDDGHWNREHVKAVIKALTPSEDLQHKVEQNCLEEKSTLRETVVSTVKCFKETINSKA